MEDDMIQSTDKDLDHVEVGRLYLGYMASPWTCVGYNADTDEASFRFGQAGWHTSDEVIVWPRDRWRSLVLSSEQPVDQPQRP